MEKLGKYEIVSEIGRGAMGAVYKARDPLIGRLVALKTITSGLSAQANSLERFYQEARSAGALQHPNIVTIYELGHENNIPFIAMEYIEGGGLDNIIEQHQALPLSVKLGYIVHVCEALSYAHRHSVIHRDVKPANIMVTKEGVVKVVDFGIARLTDMSLTQPNMMIGSRAYMSPQMYKGERADARTDIWAVGVTLYELLANRRPFNGDSEAELMFHIITDDPPPLKSFVQDCPDELTQIIGRMLEKKSEDRYQSMEDVSRELEPVWKAAQQATVAGLLADSQQLFAANDLQRAQALLRKALQIEVGNTQVKSLLDKVTVELRRSQILPKVNEHLERSRGFLQSGKLREARSELDAALGLDSRHEPAQKLREELEAAAARALEVEQKLRLTKQRLAEGALTEAATALALALQLDRNNPQGQELKRQIEVEAARREKRKKLTEVLHQARTLWTTLNYEECLKSLSEALKEFPNEPELIKLQEMARHDLEDLQKQQQLGEVRKLLGRQEFAQARKMIDPLAKKYPQDSAVKNLQNLVLDGEREQQKTKRLADEMAGLRASLSTGKVGDALAKGNALLREYPEEFELKEFVEYARGEVAQQEQRQKEKDWEKQIRGLMEQEKFKDAEAAAKRAAQELPKIELFQKLAEEAGQKKTVQERGELARLEMHRRIEEIRGNLKQDKFDDAITLARQTMGRLGPDPNVMQLLDTATRKAEERKKKEQAEKQFSAAKTMVNAGDFAGATQVLNQGMATQILERSDPRVKQTLKEIEKLSATALTKAPSEKTTAAPLKTSETPREKIGSTQTKQQAPVPPPQPMFSDSAVLNSAMQNQAGRLAAEPIKDKSAQPNPVGLAFARAVAGVRNVWGALTASLPEGMRKYAALGAAGGVALILIIVVVVVAANRGPSRKEQQLRTQASKQWSSHDLDAAIQSWRELENLRGTFQKEATQKIKDAEDDRQQENQLMQRGETLLADPSIGTDLKLQTDAANIFHQVIDKNLWRVEDAKADLARAVPSSLPPTDLHAEEQAHFDKGKALYDGGSFEQARIEFLAMRGLKVPDSTLLPQAEKLLRQMAQKAESKKLYDSAIQEMKEEHWSAAQDQFGELSKRKDQYTKDATQKLHDVTAAMQTMNGVQQLLHVGNFRDAKSQIDKMQQWPKSQSTLRAELASTESQQLGALQSRSRALIDEGKDADAMDHLLDQVRFFEQRAVEGSSVRAAETLGAELGGASLKARQSEGGGAWDKAVTDFNAAKQKGDVDRLRSEVFQEFTRIANATGIHQGAAKTYLAETIPGAIKELSPSLTNRVLLPAIGCTGSGAPANAGSSVVPCEQLDANAPLHWLGTPAVEFPEVAKQPGKLPYILKLTVRVDAKGKVKVEKNGEANEEFFKKAKDAAKQWKTSVPMAGGKPVSTSFPLEISFS